MHQYTTHTFFLTKLLNASPLHVVRSDSCSNPQFTLATRFGLLLEVFVLVVHLLVASCLQDDPAAKKNGANREVR